MGIFSPLRTWVDEFIPYYMEIMGVDRPGTHVYNTMGPQTYILRGFYGK